ncbi:hypothetical protein AK812_SmicGene1289 [Symbiodinium microadriaticum]|uniref:Uncharacterized protein n=1 Tax=Symbiodinium microadriaticum TaxID=2951 RepID=A0A1Q9F4A1_SYMMI|nr:hypothetical protein AK812_SmicGene1289 [Symbiodinium microadriaticum]
MTRIFAETNKDGNEKQPPWWVAHPGNRRQQSTALPTSSSVQNMFTCRKLVTLKTPSQHANIELQDVNKCC